jgi:hypothetical protein
VVVFGGDARGGWCWFLVVMLMVAGAGFWCGVMMVFVVFNGRWFLWCLMVVLVMVMLVFVVVLVVAVFYGFSSMSLLLMDFLKYLDVRQCSLFQELSYVFSRW